MAGESPDKSEQQKSSGETTPGERDPRLAVARSAGASTEGRVDQPTAVFRTLPSEPAERTEPAESSEPASPVTDEDTDGDAPAAVSGSGAAAEPEAPEERPSEGPSSEDRAHEERASEERPSEERSEGGDERAPDGDDRLRAAVAAWVSGKEKGANDSADGSADGSVDASDRSADESADESVKAGAARSEGGASDGDEADAEAPEAAEGCGTSEVAPSAREEAGRAGKRPTTPAPRKSLDAEPPAESGGTEDGGSEDDEQQHGEQQHGENERGGNEGGDGEADSGARTPSWAAARKAGKGAGAAQGASSHGAGSVVSADPAKAAAEEDDADDRTPVYQPTAVFKALPRPAVDQPTTALKITPPPTAPKQTTKSSAPAESSASSASSAQSGTGRPDAERTGPERSRSERSGSEGSEKEAERTTALRITAPPGDRAKAEPKTGAKPAAEPDGGPGSRGGSGDGTGARTPSGRGGASGDGAPAAPASKPASGRGSGDAPESAAERTSTFVPLRRDDARPAASAAQSAPATAKPAGPGTPSTTPPASLTEPERTKQQPLPPKPPLDLLAELTNTPPPPQTPVRTVVRRVRIWTPLVVLLLIVFAVAQSLRPLPEPALSLTAEPTYAFEGSTPQLPWPAKGQAYMAASGLGTLGSSGEQKPVPIASVTKSMTAYVILKNHPLKPGEAGPMIEIDAKGESDGQLDKTDNESTLNTVKKGDKISLRDALAAIMIPSANNIARQLARWDSGSEKAFVEKMNAAAEELGMKNTTYTDPSGLDATTVSTAEDQVKLGLKLVEIKALMDITKLPEWTDPSGKKWRNYNELPPYDGALGIKTGSTTKAGGNLLFAAHKMVGDTDQLIVGAVLAQHDTPILGTAIKASRDLMLATQDALKNATIVKKGQVVGVVEDGLGGSVPVVATKDVRAVGWSGLTVKLELTNGGKVPPHEAAAGTVVGSLTVGEGASQVTVPVALQEALVEPGFGAKLTRLG